MSNMDAYSRVTKGKLKLKRAARNQISAEKCKKQQLCCDKDGNPVTDEERTEAEDVPTGPGSGRIVSCGTSIHGFETKFTEEAAVGDDILICHPQLHRLQSRTVMGIYSQRSLVVNEPFTSDLVSTINFQIKRDSLRLLKASEEEAKKQVLEEELKQQLNADDFDVQVARDGSSDGIVVAVDPISQELQKKLNKAAKYETITYREKTGMWGYKTVTKKVKIGGSTDNSKAELTAERKLDLRSKRTGRDKYC